MKLNFVTLENDKDYLIFEEIETEKGKYLYLVNEKDENDFCIRKVIVEDNDKFLTALDSEEEFNEAIKLFNKSNKN